MDSILPVPVLFTHTLHTFQCQTQSVAVASEDIEMSRFTIHLLLAIMDHLVNQDVTLEFEKMAMAPQLMGPLFLEGNKPPSEVYVHVYNMSLLAKVMCMLKRTAGSYIA